MDLRELGIVDAGHHYGAGAYERPGRFHSKAPVRSEMEKLRETASEVTSGNLSWLKVSRQMPCQISAPLSRATNAPVSISVSPPMQRPESLPDKFTDILSVMRTAVNDHSHRFRGGRVKTLLVGRIVAIHGTLFQPLIRGEIQSSRK